MKSVNDTVVVSNFNTGYQLIWLYILWIFFFFTTSLPNLLIALTVSRYSALRNRKEYLTVAALSFADFLYILGFSGSGIHRLYLIYTGRWTSVTSLRSCVVLPQNLIFLFAIPASGMMLVVLLLDRFLAVAMPIKYFTLTTKYAYCMVVIVYGLGISMFVQIVGMSFWQENVEVPATCFGFPVILVISKLHALFFMYSRSMGGFLSVLLYVGVGVAYWKRLRHVGSYSNSTTTTTRERKLQNQLTKNLALSCLCTTILLVIPTSVANTGELFGLPSGILQIPRLLPPFNPFCNIVIYYKRQPDLRKGMRAFLVNKTMPSNLDLWQTVIKKSRNQGRNVGADRK